MPRRPTPTKRKATPRARVLKRRAMPRPALSADAEDHRDRYWRREDARRVGDVHSAERFIEEVGFAACLTDTRRPGPSLYIAVCGRRDAVLPRNVQKDPESSETWLLKDELIRRGKVYYAKLARGKAMFVAPRMVPHFRALWGLRRAQEAAQLSPDARAVLRALRREWEMATIDLRADSGVQDRRRFAKAMDELQAAMLVVPSEVLYLPKFTYLWTIADGRFPDTRRRTDRAVALRELARAFLTASGMTIPGELARVTGLSRKDAGLGNRALVAEGFAISPRPGVYLLAKPPEPGHAAEAPEPPPDDSNDDVEFDE